MKNFYYATSPSVIVACRRIVLTAAGLLFIGALSACAGTTTNTTSDITSDINSPGPAAVAASGKTVASPNINADRAASLFVTLGTNGGPVADLNRSQSSNALRVGDDLYLVDAGDGAASQLAKAGMDLEEVKAVFISHLHFDHTGGMLAVLGLRRQVNAENKLSIYGPPGTQFLVEGLLASMGPTMKAAYGMPGREWRPNLEVIELVDGSVVELKGLTVTTAENSHFAIPENADTPEKAKSLSFRFDMADRSIAFTGDTGPSESVEKLAKGADLLVSEMMDIPVVLAGIKKESPYMPEKVLAGIEWHFRAHHLTPEQVGELAAAAEVKAVVISHIAPSVASPEYAQRITARVGAAYAGSVTLANDLDRY